MIQKKYLPMVLLLLDGWGVAPPSKGNAIAVAKTPNMDALVKAYPACTLQSSGPPVGLRFGEVGNSEVGHCNLGTGRVVYQTLPRIGKAIADGSFFRNAVLTEAMERCRNSRRRAFAPTKGGYSPQLHLIGILSDSGVHGHMEHLFALLSMAKEFKVQNVFVHVFLDGRDALYNSGLGYLEQLKRYMKGLPIGKIASIGGRFYAMDRDRHWERIKKVYDALVLSKASRYTTNPLQTVKDAYKEKMYDEEFLPTVVVDKNQQPIGRIQDGDSVIFLNYRADRARELTTAFMLPGFPYFKRRKFLKDLYFATMTDYGVSFPVHVVFERQDFPNVLSKVFSQAGLRQLRVAETEKYAHVTFFFNGLSEQVHPGEEHIIVPSLRIAHFDERPEMSAKEVTKTVLQALITASHDVIIVNFANADMVAHTGNFDATVQAVESVDRAVGEIIEVVLANNGVAMITSDHGNAEELMNLQTREIDKGHNSNPVPFILIGKEFEGKNLFGVNTVDSDLSLMNPRGVLSDVASTMLHLLGLEKPPEFTGVSLIS